MDRIADIFRFRAEAVRLNWASILERVQFPTLLLIPPGLLALQELVSRRSGDIRVTWATSQELGVPYGPFTVWTRPRPSESLEEVDVVTWRAFNGLALWWGGEQAARVRVTFDVPSPGLVGLILFRTAPTLQGAVAAVTANAPGGQFVLDVRTSGAVFGLLMNGQDPRVSITRLDDVIRDRTWTPVELVGLPVEDPWEGTEYDPSPQGPVDSLVSPRDAAIGRLKRGGPPFGWHPLTETGRTTPAWSAPDPEALVEEVQKQLLPEIARLYDGSVPEYDQWRLEARRPVDPPQQAGRRSQLPASADAKPWAALGIPAHTDAFLNLATGFGACYSLEPMMDGQIAVGNSDFLVTAPFRKVLPEGLGGAELAAYAPQAATQHLGTAVPRPLSAVRSGLVPPAMPDLPWRESIRLGWKKPPTFAGFGIPTESALLRYSPVAGSEVEALIEKRDPSGWRPLAISPDPPVNGAPSDRTSVVDGGAEIPLGSGGRTVGYSVAVTDVYGVWSRWADAPYSGDEPGPEGARVISLALETTFAGSTNCPGTLRLEVATEWLQRRTKSIDLVAVFFPMAAPTSPPPAGLIPETTPPAGCFRRTFGIDFVGDDPLGLACDVIALNRDGTGPATPGPDQGDSGRRYAVSTPVTLDFGATRRWGVQVWARRHLFVGSSPSGWLPAPTSPAIATAASPVPIVPLLPPLDGVPLASLPDADGRAHARISWSLPAGAPARRTAVWELAETALRQTVPTLTPRAPEGESPATRLATLRSAYDNLPLDRRRLLFRRVTEVEGSVRSYDFVLPKGSTDIHLFTVTPITDTGIEAPWPTGDAKSSLQAFMAPRLRRPAPPLVRSSLADDGSIVLTLSSASPIPVDRFRLLRTRSEIAARRADSMGPAFAEPIVAATATGVDTVTGHPVYTAVWTGVFPESWDEWHVRAIAIPRDTIPLEAVRGLPSEPSDVIGVIARPSGPPDLAPLVIETDAARTGVVVRTSTSAPARSVPAGDHRIGATAGSAEVATAALQALPETPLATPPPASTTEPVLERGARVSGRTPLSLWFTRAGATDSVDVAIRITDPLGRMTERTETVPAWEPPPPLTLTLVDSISILGRGVAVVVATDAPVDADPPYELNVRASGPPIGPTFPPRPPRRLAGSAKVPDIPPSGTPTPGRRIQFGWRQDDDGVRLYDIWIPLAAPMSAIIALVAPDGGRVTVAVTEE